MAIGFEFATGWQIYKDQPILPGQTTPPLFSKGFALKRTLGWDMTVDGKEIEFVVNPVEEDAQGEGNVRARMRNLAQFVGMMNQKNAQAQLRNTDFTGHLPANPRFVIYNTAQNQPIAAIPQVSAGVLLSRYRKLVRVLANPGTNAADRFFGGSAATYTGVFAAVRLRPAHLQDPRWPTHAPSAKLRGLVSLIATYIKRGTPPQAHTPMKAAKYLMVVMARTNFAGIFATLPDNERNQYRQHPNQWVNYICSSVMRNVAGFAPGGADPNAALIGYEISDQGTLAQGQRVVLPITRQAWLIAMTRGSDLLSAEAHKIGRLHPLNNPVYRDTAGVGHRLRGLGGLGQRTDMIPTPTGPKPGIIFEFRARQNPVTWDQWEDYAVRMYRFFRDLNENAKNAAVDYA